MTKHDARPPFRGTVRYARTLRDDAPRLKSVDKGSHRIVDEALSFLDEGVSVNLVGVRGSGRTEAQRLIVDRLVERGRKVTRIAGIAALNERPLAALAVAGINVSAGSSAASLGAAVTGLSRLVGTADSVVVIDDSDDLDPVSLGALLATYSNSPFLVLTTTRLGRRAVAAQTLATVVQPAVRIRVSPLRLDEVHSVVHEMLPGVVAAATVARVATTSGGLPGLVRAMVTTGRRTGALVQQDGVWRALTDLWDPLLAETVEPLLSDLSDAQVSALTRIAMTGTPETATLGELVDPDMVADLERRGLVQTTGAGARQVVGVYPPLLSAYLQDDVSTAHRRHAFDHLAPHAADDLTTPARTGAIPRLAVSVLSGQVQRHWRQSAVALRARWRADPSARNAFPLMRALESGGAEPRLIEQIYHETDVRRDDHRDRLGLAAWFEVYQATNQRSISSFADLTALVEHAPEHRVMLDAARAHATFLLDRVPVDAPAPPDGAGGSVLGAEAALEVHLESLVAGGAVERALDRMQSAVRSDAPWLAEHQDVCRSLATVLSGRVEEGTALAMDNLEHALESLEPGLIQAHGFVAVLGLSLLGRLDDLDSLLSIMLTLPGATATSEHFRAGIFRLAATAAEWQGRSEYASQLRSQIADLGHGAGPYPLMLGVPPQGGAAEADDWLWCVAEDRAERGYVTHAVFTAVAAVEQLPDPDRAAAVARSAAHVDGELLPVLVRYLTAAAAQDPAALAGIADELHAAGSPLHSTRATVTRAVALQAAGRPAESTDVAEEGWRRAAAVGPSQSGLFARLRSSVNLSTREQEVAALLADGLTVDRIAALLVLSERTVEGHILRACRRLGIESRERLVTLARTWLL